MVLLGQALLLILFIIYLWRDNLYKRLILALLYIRYLKEIEKEQINSKQPINLINNEQNSNSNRTGQS